MSFPGDIGIAGPFDLRSLFGVPQDPEEMNIIARKRMQFMLDRIKLAFDGDDCDSHGVATMLPVIQSYIEHMPVEEGEKISVPVADALDPFSKAITVLTHELDKLASFRLTAQGREVPVMEEEEEDDE